MLPSIVYSLPGIVCSGAVQNKDRKAVDHFIPKGLIFGHSNLEPLSPQPVSTSNMDNKAKCTLKNNTCFPPSPTAPHTELQLICTKVNE